MATPLTLLIPILPGKTVQEIGTLLKTHRETIEKGLDAVGTVHYARIMVLDRSKPNLQPDMKDAAKPSDTLVLAVITEFDGDFEDYIRAFVNKMPDPFNALLAFVKGGPELRPVAAHLDAFIELSRVNDASQFLPNDTPLYQRYTDTVQVILARKGSAT